VMNDKKSQLELFLTINLIKHFTAHYQLPTIGKLLITTPQCPGTAFGRNLVVILARSGFPAFSCHAYNENLWKIHATAMGFTANHVKN